MANYSGMCAISGIDIPQLLVASHILPWSIDEKERLNPENGICLSPLYDKAFDKGIISINESSKYFFAPIEEKNTTSYHQKFFGSVDGVKIMKPTKYLPNKTFLQFHLDNIFKG